MWRLILTILVTIFSSIALIGVVASYVLGSEDGFGGFIYGVCIDVLIITSVWLLYLY